VVCAAGRADRLRVLNGDIFAAGMLQQDASDSGVAPERVAGDDNVSVVIIGTP